MHPTFMPLIIPAILEYSPAAVTTQLDHCAQWNGIKRVQIDFVSQEFNQKTTPSVEQLILGKYMFSLESHIMDTTCTDIEPYAHAGFSRVIIHSSNYKTDAPRISFLLKQAQQFQIEFGCAVNPGQDLPSSELLASCDSLLFLTVQPGKQGNQFEPEVLSRIAEVRKQFHGIIEVDGGIKKSRITQLLTAGADELIVGSAIWNTEDPEQSFNELSQIISHA